MSRTMRIIGGVLVVVALFVLLYSAKQPMHNSPAQNITQVIIGTDSTSSPQAAISVEVADTAAAREQGLSGRAGLAPNSGMLFVFDTPGNYGFWMKDMNFPLDMLFADADGTIVTIDQNLSPQSYNSADPQSSGVFYPAKPVEYVLEVPAGFAKAHGIVVGQVMQFK